MIMKRKIKLNTEPEIKNRIGRRIENNRFSPIVHKCSNPKCKYRVMSDDFGISECSMCGTKTNVIPSAKER